MKTKRDATLPASSNQTTSKRRVTYLPVAAVDPCASEREFEAMLLARKKAEQAALEADPKYSRPQNGRTKQISADDLL